MRPMNGTLALKTLQIGFVFYLILEAFLSGAYAVKSYPLS